MPVHESPDRKDLTEISYQMQERRTLLIRTEEAGRGRGTKVALCATSQTKYCQKGQ